MGKDKKSFQRELLLNLLNNQKNAILNLHQRKETAAWAPAMRKLPFDWHLLKFRYIPFFNK